jgi:hypothetical protein
MSHSSCRDLRRDLSSPDFLNGSSNDPKVPEVPEVSLVSQLGLSFVCLASQLAVSLVLVVSFLSSVSSFSQLITRASNVATKL